MLLDYSFSDKLHRLDLSYIDDNGSKKLLQFNINRFKSFYKTPTGKYQSWDGSRCDIKWTEKPSTFDIKYYFKEMDEKYRQLISKRTFPKVYTFDIETYIPEDNEFPKPEEGKFPITTISIVSPEMNCIVLATKELSENELNTVKNNFNNYLDNTEFYKELKLKNKPYFQYIKFDDEESMLKFFLKNIVSKTPVLSGWNCIFFDWYYITTRIQNYFPNISLKDASCTNVIERKRYVNERGDEIYLPMPQHTLILDMMQVIKDEDYVVMPIKESYGLDYISHESMGINKIEYDGTLQDLYEKDYPRYVYYNAIDSILVQLINYRFKTLDHIYMYSLYCTEKIGRCFSKIAVTEALVFQDFYDLGLKIPYEKKEIEERGRLIGAYVKIPIPGLHEYVCCNDFASLYPSSIRTCNLSFENYIGSYYDYEKIKQYECNPRYIIIGPNVHVNSGTISHPEIGRCIGTFLNDEYLKKYREDPNYFVSVNGSVYKNDKDYSFRRIQGKLKQNRDESKYLAKQLDAEVMYDLAHLIDDKQIENRLYIDRIKRAIEKIGIEATCSNDLKKYTKEQLIAFQHALKEDIVYYTCHEQAMKLLMNSMYGGSSHKSFYWFNMALANDITGESRNLIHKMEHHIPEWFADNWVKSKELHHKLGIEISEEQAQLILDNIEPITVEKDPDAYHGKSFVKVVYGDTDSLYISYNDLLKTIKGYDDMSISQKRDILVKLNTIFLDQHNKEFIEQYYNTRHGKSVHNFELETLNRSGIWGDVKKRYAQILLWKDGKIFDIDSLPLKVKGLEMVKSSFPKLSRNILKKLFTFMLNNAGDKYLIQRLNQEMMKCKHKWEISDIENISGSIKVNNYFKYVKDDTVYPALFNIRDPKTGEMLKTAPWNVRALANYNSIRNTNNLPGEPIYGGLMKWYIIKEQRNPKDPQMNYFVYQASNLPKWSQQYAPIDKSQMFQQTVIDPINRMLGSNNMPLLNKDGSLQISLF